MHRIGFVFLVFSLMVTAGCSVVTKTAGVLSPVAMRSLEGNNMTLGNAIFIRIFKEESQLELWVKDDGGKYRHFKNYDICQWSGELGPKVVEGDKQAPEGFYRVSQEQLNPDSNYHFAFNIGYPNNYDKLHNRTGSYIMVHGGCSSAGCFAVRNLNIQEIYLLASAAFQMGTSSFDVHIFPFRMTREAMARHRYSRWHGFWRNLKAGYDHFELHKTVPIVRISRKTGKYVFYNHYDYERDSKNRPLLRAVSLKKAIGSYNRQKTAGFAEPLS